MRIVRIVTPNGLPRAHQGPVSGGRFWAPVGADPTLESQHQPLRLALEQALEAESARLVAFARRHSAGRPALDLGAARRICIRDWLATRISRPTYARYSTIQAELDRGAQVWVQVLAGVAPGQILKAWAAVTTMADVPPMTGQMRPASCPCGCGELDGDAWRWDTVLEFYIVEP